MLDSRNISLALIVCLAALSGCATTSQVQGNGVEASEAVSTEVRETRFSFAALTPAEQAIVYLWLNANCAVDSEERQARLVGVGSEVEAALVEAFHMGPPIASLQQLADIRRAEFEGMQRALRTNERTAIDPDLRRQLATLSEDTYVADGIARTIVNYRLAALNGLEVVGSAASLTWLKITLPTVTDPDLSRAGERTLAALQQRSRR